MFAWRWEDSSGISIGLYEDVEGPGKRCWKFINELSGGGWGNLNEISWPFNRVEVIIVAAVSGWWCIEGKNIGIGGGTCRELDAGDVERFLFGFDGVFEDGDFGGSYEKKTSEELCDLLEAKGVLLAKLKTCPELGDDHPDPEDKVFAEFRGDKEDSNVEQLVFEYSIGSGMLFLFSTECCLLNFRWWTW